MSAVDRRMGVTGSVALKAPCRVATVANITLDGLQTVDNIVLQSGDRVLVKDQNNAVLNGIYVADTGPWQRAADFNGLRDIVQGTLVMVAAGSLNASTVFRLATSSPVIDTTSLAFTRFWPEETTPIAPYTPPGGGGGNLGLTSRFSYAVKCNAVGNGLVEAGDSPSGAENDYWHFTRGVSLPDGRLALHGYHGENHGGGDGDSLFLEKFVTTVGSPLTLDGQDGGGGTTFTFVASPSALIFYSNANDSAMQFTIDGTYDLDGVVTAGSEVVSGPNASFVKSLKRWWSGTVTADRLSVGAIQFGRQAAPSSHYFAMSRNGGRSFYNRYNLVDGLANQIDQGYQAGLVYTRSNKFVAFFYKNNILTEVNGTYRNVNTMEGDPLGWMPEPEPILFNGLTTINGSRPIFNTQVFVKANGDLWTLLQGGAYLHSATSTDEGANWTTTVFVKVGRTTADVLTITDSDIATKTFELSSTLGDKTANFPLNRKFLIWNSTGTVHNGVYTVVSAVYSGGRTIITVSETVNSDTGSGQISLSGVVAVNTGTKTFTLGGTEHATNLAAGDVICINNSVANDQLYTVVSATAGTGVTNVVVSEAIVSSSVSGRVQNATLGEFGVGFIDDMNFVAMGRSVRGGQVFAEQFVSYDGGASRATYLGRPAHDINGVSVSGTAVSHYVSTSRIGGRVLLTHWYHWRSNTGNAYSVCYRTADALAALESSHVWMPERCIVSTTTALETASGDVFASGTYKRHGYPFVATDPSGETHTLFLSLEVANDRSNLYAVRVRPEYQQYFGGWIDLATVTAAGTDNDYIFDTDLDAFSEIIFEISASADANGQFALRVSEDRSTFLSTGEYDTVGSTGTSTSLMPMHNVSATTPAVVRAHARLSRCNSATEKTISRAFGGVNNSSTSGGTVSSERTAAAVLKRLQWLHTGGNITGTCVLRGRV